jgi:hypothetical protein
MAAVIRWRAVQALAATRRQAERGAISGHAKGSEQHAAGIGRPQGVAEHGVHGHAAAGKAERGEGQEGAGQIRGFRGLIAMGAVTVVSVVTTGTVTSTGGRASVIRSKSGRRSGAGPFAFFRAR